MTLEFCCQSNLPDFNRFPSTCPTSITSCTTWSYPCPRHLLLTPPGKTSSEGGYYCHGNISTQNKAGVVSVEPFWGIMLVWGGLALLLSLLLRLLLLLFLASGYRGLASCTSGHPWHDGRRVKVLPRKWNHSTTTWTHPYLDP